jgi:hypothetical protein
MDAAAGTANAKVLLNPLQSPAVVRSREHVSVVVADFHGLLGIESGGQSVEARAWGAAATEFKDKVSRQEQTTSMLPGVSVTRPSTGPDR